MDSTSTPSKKARKSPYPWTNHHKLVLERIINTDNNGRFNEKLKSKNRDTQMQAWTDIIEQFRIAFCMNEVDRKGLQGLWQRMKGQDKVVYDRTLLNLYRETRTTGGGVGPSQVTLMKGLAWKANLTFLVWHLPRILLCLPPGIQQTE